MGWGSLRNLSVRNAPRFFVYSYPSTSGPGSWELGPLPDDSPFLSPSHYRQDVRFPPAQPMTTEVRRVCGTPHPCGETWDLRLGDILRLR